MLCERSLPVIKKLHIFVLVISSSFVALVGICPGLSKTVVDKPWSVQRTNLFSQAFQQNIRNILNFKQLTEKFMYMLFKDWAQESSRV